ncbi:DUF805 domain-containing protein [Sphingopyxis panaciterrae]
MGSWLDRNFAWHGETGRDEYRRWLPLVVVVDLALLWATYEFAERGTVDMGSFGWIGAPLFLIAMLYYFGWLCLTARRLRAAKISRAWLIFAFLTINLPVGGFYINFTMIAAILLTAVAAVAPDRDPLRAA